MSQYADDRSLILDRSPESLATSLRTLDTYANLSGLNINLDKTEVVWIGKKKISKETICVKWGFEWVSSILTLLGLHFSVDLNENENLNYDRRMKEIENIIKTWTNQILSPMEK